MNRKQKFEYLNKKYKAKDLLNIIRARSFKKGDCSYFMKDGKKYNLRLEIDEVNLINHKGWDSNIYESYEELPPTKSLLSNAWVDKEFSRLPLSKKDLKIVKKRNSLLLEYINKGDCVLDFGGSLGFSYLACEDESLKYHILETESICNMGEKLYQNVKFHSIIPTNLDLDILYIRTSLQYSQNWIVTLKKLLENKPKLLVFNHPHVFSVIALDNLLNRNGLEIVKVENLSVHGGSNRIYAMKKGVGTVDVSVEQNKTYERILGLDKLETFVRFAEKVNQSKSDLLRLLKKCKEEGKKVISYGGHHAVINWLIQQSKGIIKYHNNCELGWDKGMFKPIKRNVESIGVTSDNFVTNVYTTEDSNMEYCPQHNFFNFTDK